MSASDKDAAPEEKPQSFSVELTMISAQKAIEPAEKNRKKGEGLHQLGEQLRQEMLRRNPALEKLQEEADRRGRELQLEIQQNKLVAAGNRILPLEQRKKEEELRKLLPADQRRVLATMNGYTQQPSKWRAERLRRERQLELRVKEAQRLMDETVRTGKVPEELGSTMKIGLDTDEKVPQTQQISGPKNREPTE